MLMTTSNNLTLDVGPVSPTRCNVSQLYREPFLWYTYFVLLFLLGLPCIFVGVFTSLLSYLMFLFDRFTPKTTKLFLKTLSLVDCLYLFGLIIYIELKVIYRLFPETESALRRVESQQPWYDIFTVILNCLELFRNWGTVLIGTERYLVTCHPFRSTTWCTHSRAVTSLIVCAVGTLLLRSPLMVRRVLNLHFINSTSKEIKEISELAYKIHLHVDSFFLTLVPVLLLGFFSFRITQTLHRSNKMLGKNTVVVSSNNANLQNATKSTTSSSLLLASQASSGTSTTVTASTNGPPAHRRRVQHVTRMLTVVLMVFSICGLPSLVTVIAHYVVFGTSAETCLNKSIQLASAALCYFMNILFSTSNFFVYVIYMPRYRLILRQMLYASLRCSWNSMKWEIRENNTVTTPGQGQSVAGDVITTTNNSTSSALLQRHSSKYFNLHNNAHRHHHHHQHQRHLLVTQPAPSPQNRPSSQVLLMENLKRSSVPNMTPEQNCAVFV